MVINLSEQHSLLSTWVRELRDVAVQTDRARFRRNMERIGEVAAYEISKTLAYEAVSTETPMGTAQCCRLAVQPVLATILRAGVPLHQGLLNYFDHADCAFVAAYRKHHRDGSFEIEQHYLTSPTLEGRPLILADPMLATGASLVQALEALVELGKPSSIHVVTAIAAADGVAMLTRKFPEATLWIAALDEELTARGYIVPGLGDAGDLSFGEKEQF